MKSIQSQLSWPGREEIHLRLTVDDQGSITQAQLTGIGSSALLKHLLSYRKELKGALRDLPIPRGDGPETMALREVVLRAKGEWQPPYTDEELCHCRVVATQKVDLAICMGAHTVRRVQELTSASTACGTCRPDVEAMIKFRLVRP